MIGPENLILDIIDCYVTDGLYASEIQSRVATLFWSILSPEKETNICYISTIK
jgi:hypothetical protein